MKEEGVADNQKRQGGGGVADGINKALAFLEKMVGKGMGVKVCLLMDGDIHS